MLGVLTFIKSLRQLQGILTCGSLYKFYELQLVDWDLRHESSLFISKPILSFSKGLGREKCLKESVEP